MKPTEVLITLVIGFLLYFQIAVSVFLYRHPCVNRMAATWHHAGDSLTFTSRPGLCR